MQQYSKLPKITVRKVMHYDNPRIGLFSKYNVHLIKIIKTIPNSRWSKSLKCWHLPDHPDSFAALDKLKDHLSFYTLQNKKNKDIPLTEFDEDTLIELEQFQDYLKQLRYADRTVESYMQVMKVFANWMFLNKKEGIDLATIRAFNLKYFVEGKYSRSYQNIFVNAIRLYLLKIEDRQIPLELIERPRKSQYLPNILSEQEVKRLLKSYDNLKHRSIIMTYYACGLRKSELINLKLSDIDSDRMLVRIRNSKGAKDRDVSLPQTLLTVLRNYVEKYKPKVYLFNGRDKLQYSPRSVDNLLSQGLKRCNITKKITTHSLRHSYATHLVEKNINLRYIQDALGHNSSKTTEIYTRLSKEKIANMVSPIDFWDEEKGD